ncbi:MAG TPA: Cro/Cl family transcriptional regulator [Gammaproteobacteria bacterium]|nr:Cro/Cl family transcriptional regulator [Gammaproteobacteria bacterium]
MTIYLAPTETIDFDAPNVRAKARELAASIADERALVARCFTFVRDAIKHSWDHRLNPVTCRASDVLRHGTGYCYAKSHLLAALLRANGVPAGLCYQRLSVNDAGPPYCLHGLNAVHLRAYGWYRLDARGNKAGVTTRFCPPREVLAFPIRGPEECDLPGILAEPLPAVVTVLEKYRDVRLVHANVPDVAPAAWRAVAGDPHSISR